MIITKKKFLLINFSIRKNIIPFLFVVFIISLVIFAPSNLPAAKKGLLLWFNNVIPSLFPFFIANELLLYTNIPMKISNVFSKVMRPLFNAPNCAAYAFLIGIISGYPVGAKIVTSFRQDNFCSKDEGSRMLCFTNNSGPLFVLGTVGTILFKNSMIGFLLLITHILSALTIALLLGFYSRIFKKNSTFTSTKNISNSHSTTVCNFSNLGEILTSSIMNSAKTIIMIGGFVILFSVIVSILNASHILDMLQYMLYPLFKMCNLNLNFFKPFLAGLLEITNGIDLISAIPYKNITINIVICAFMLGFGGISIFLQVLSIISKSDLSIKYYIIGKIFQGIIAAFYTYIFISNFYIFNFNL